MGLLPIYQPEVEAISLVSPCVDNKTQGHVAGEETNQAFMDSMKDDGYHYLYRGILDPVWLAHLEGEDEYDAMARVAESRPVPTFIGHGKKDWVIHYSKSETYLEKLRAAHSEHQDKFKLELYEGDHGPSTTNPAARDLVKWLESLGLLKLN